MRNSFLSPDQTTATFEKNKTKVNHFSVSVFSAVVLIVDTVNKQTNITNKKLVKNPNR